MLRNFMPVTCLLLTALAVQAQGSSTCQSVYADSVRNVDLQTRVLAEQNDLFSRHCETNGSLKSSSANLDLTVPVKTIKVGFSGSQSEAQQTMQEFCKTYSERLSRFDSFYQFNSHVVVDALKSFNQCMELEARNVRISHVATDSRSLVVRVGFNPAEDIVTLNSVQYDPAVATCSSNINGEGKPITVWGKSGQINAKGPFSVACERIALRTSNGEFKFPRLELLVDISHGAYAVALPTETMLGYDLANANRQAILAATQEQIRLKNEAEVLKKETEALRKEGDGLRGKIAGVRADAQFTVQGDGAQAPCSVPINTFVQNSCQGGLVSGLVQVSNWAGGRCGYTSYKWSCIFFP